MAIKNIGIITSGGDCGGLNAVIRGIALTAQNRGLKSFIIPNGYAGLYNLVTFDRITELTQDRIEQIDICAAGSEAGNSRVKVSKIQDEHKYERIRDGLKKFNIDALLIAGGDDTGSVVADLSQQGIKCIHIPKTMDLDLMTYSVGGDSTIQRIAEFARDLRTTGRTHNRVIVMEVFGRYAGHTAFRGGVAAGADAVLVPEIPVDFDFLYKFVRDRLFDRIGKSDVHAGTVMIVVAEGLRDASGNELVDPNAPLDSFGHKKLMGAGRYAVKQIEDRIKKDPEIREFMKRTGQFVDGVYEIPEVRELRPGHLVRCGFTTPVDACFGLEVGAGAVHLALEGTFGVTVAGSRNGMVQYMDIKDAIQQRFIDEGDVKVYESLGLCFGRPMDAHVAMKGEKISGRPHRPY
ncbi:MAG: 6-phosphofructokinase [Spirochaetae bacterium HGW-Spirochaetae-10]|nr:MAG: 6-phosphofructokinase [Spirochaetae bacterium HGW-Spirochaetae-10]